MTLAETSRDMMLICVALQCEPLYMELTKRIPHEYLEFPQVPFCDILTPAGYKWIYQQLHPAL